MRIRMLLAIMFTAALLAAGSQTAAKEPVPAAQPKAGSAKTAPAGQTVPAGAEKVDLGTWRYKDAAGKVWIYRKTPFGLVHFEEKAETEAPAPPQMKAFESGDKVRFENSGPFGTVKWVKAKSELTDVERRVWERDSKKAGETGAAKPSDAAGK
jgi:hypothetical protein